MELIRGDFRVEWSYIGEGWYGEYDEDNPEDEALLRFYCSYWDEEAQDWIDIDDASYCTRFPYETSPQQQMEGLQILMDAFYDRWRDTGDIKRQAAEHSWIDLSWLEAK